MSTSRPMPMLIQMLLDTSPFLRLLRKTLGSRWSRMAALVLAAGLTDVFLLPLINTSVDSLNAGDLVLRDLVMGVCLLGLYVLVHTRLIQACGSLMGDLIHDARMHLLRRLRRTGAPIYERVGAAEVELCLSRDLMEITTAGLSIPDALTNVVWLIGSLVYVGLLSPMCFAFLALSDLLGFIYQLHNRRRVVDGQQRAMAVESKLFAALDDALNGFKELRMDTRRAEALLVDHVTSVSDASTRIRAEVHEIRVTNWLFGDLFPLIQIGLVVFVFPTMGTFDSVVLAKIVLVLILTMGVHSNIMLLVSMWTRLDLAVESLEKLEARLVAEHDGGDEDVQDLAPPILREELSLHGIEMKFPADHEAHGFQIGPIDLTLRPGQIVFLIGGNGSGKSTILKTLCGLYAPSAGNVTLDGSRVARTDSAGYRRYFSCVFTDFHLFDRFYGHEAVEEGRVREMLKTLQLDEHVQFAEGRLSRTDLSTGQQKRLALLGALVQDRPVLILDEVAADQDPDFRRYYYDILLPQLRRQGKALLVVSHDDRYFHVADRVIRVDYGRIIDARDQSTSPSTP